MSPEEALEQMKEKQDTMAKEAERMVERVRRLQDISYCMESNHEWIVDIVDGATHTQVDFLRIACTSCDAFFNVGRINEQNATITPLCMTHEGKDMTVQAFLNGGEEE
jgi:hypothetical protein